EKTYTIDDGQVQLRHIASLDNKLPAVAYNNRPSNGDRLYSFSYDGQQYVASYATLPLQIDSKWQLFIITPLDDFMHEFKEHNAKLLIIGLIAIALEIVVIYILSAALSAPLERLALKVGRIESLTGEEERMRESPIREISVLQKAIDTLDATVKSFAAFVPVGLV